MLMSLRLVIERSLPTIAKSCRFPVPLTLDVIQSRLETNYYRRFAAMKHDVEVLLQNAEAYFGRNKDISMKMRRLSDWFTRTLSL